MLCLHMFVCVCVLVGVEWLCGYASLCICGFVVLSVGLYFGNSVFGVRVFLCVCEFVGLVTFFTKAYA